MSHGRISLETIAIPNPCPADWSAMTPAQAGRFCSHCRKTVQDISALSRDDAERLVCESAGQLCIRMMRDTAGHVVTLDYQQDLAGRRGWKYWTGVGLLGALAAGILSAVLGRGIPGTMTGVVMGGMPCWPMPNPPVATPASSEVASTSPLPPPLVETEVAAIGGRRADEVPMELRVR